MDLKYSEQFARFFDRLRFEKGLTQEEFVESIISLRQYRRYLNGSSNMPQDVIDQFAVRLGHRPHHIMLEFESEKIQESKTIERLYNLVVNRDFDNAHKFMKEFPIEKVTDQENKTLYIHTINIYEHLTKKISDLDLIKKTCKLVDYPNVLERKSMSINELIMLTSLIGYSVFPDRDLLADKLLYYADHTHLIYSGRNEGILTYIIVQVAKHYGMNNNQHKVLEACDRALKFNQAIKLNYLWDFIYYYQALAHFKLGNIEEHEKALFRLYNVLHAEGSSAKFERFKRLVEDDWPIDFHQFALNYMKKNYISIKE